MMGLRVHITIMLVVDDSGHRCRSTKPDADPGDRREQQDGDDHRDPRVTHCATVP
jgi:hypothetical protein